MSTLVRDYLDRAAVSAVIVAAAMLLTGIAFSLGIDESVLYASAFGGALVACMWLFSVRARNTSLSRALASSPEIAEAWRNVLFVDYDRILETNLSRVFMSHGMSVDTVDAASVEWSKYASASWSYDLVVFNADLPYVTLFEVKRELDKARSRIRYVVVGVAKRTTPNHAKPAVRVVETSGEASLQEDFEAVLR